MEIKLYNCKAFDIHIDKLPNITFKVLQKKNLDIKKALLATSRDLLCNQKT